MQLTVKDLNNLLEELNGKSNFDVLSNFPVMLLRELIAQNLDLHHQLYDLQNPAMPAAQDESKRSVGRDKEKLKLYNRNYRARLKAQSNQQPNSIIDVASNQAIN